jgi:hypothetical protein
VPDPATRLAVFQNIVFARRRGVTGVFPMPGLVSCESEGRACDCFSLAENWASGVAGVYIEVGEL